ncbi:MAG: NosD domain-containing protein [Candidatus Marinimicrobia bacterium]|nr:NosD domain-containing protein [Candidatus Neomarinimicrobiota bacterium]
MYFKKTCIYLSFLFLFVGNVYSQQPPKVWVSTEYDENTTGWGSTHFAVIQEAVNAVAEAGTVKVDTGTYYESVGIKEKGLHLIGSGADETVINADSANYAVLMKNVNDCSISSFSFTGTAGDEHHYETSGLFIDTCQNISVRNNKIFNNKYSGIKLRNSENITINENIIFDNGDKQWTNESRALDLDNSHNSIIINNDLDNIYTIQLVHSWGNRIENNNINSKGPLALIMSRSSNNIIKNNVFFGGGCNFIRAKYSDRNLIANNEFNGDYTRYGIYLTYSNGNIIANNKITHISQYGIGLYHADSTQILGNTLSEPEWDIFGGIIMWGSSCNNTIKGNKISDMPKGISLYYNTNKNKIVNNRVSNSEYEIIIDNSNDNIIYKNNFEDKQINAFDNGNNNWSENEVGNYWRDYKDENSSNNNASRYQIPPHGLDPYPTTTPFSIEDVVVPSLNPADFWKFPGYPYTEITGDVTWNGETKDIENEVFIIGGGSLTITNCNLNFLPRKGAELSVGDGTLRILGSKIFGNGMIFSADENSTVEIRNSEIYSLWSWDGHPNNSFKTKNAVIKDNLIEDVYFLPIWDNTEFINNTVKNTYIGINIMGSGCLLEQNKVVNTISNGIINNDWQSSDILGAGNNNHIKDNIIQNTWGFAIELANECTNNQIYGNDFSSYYASACLGNAESYDPINMWYSDNQGNFYSDYLDRYPNAEEHHEYDGIWNIPYEIFQNSENNTDDYPSMHILNNSQGSLPPNIPHLLSPVNDSTVTTAKPSFSWSAAGDSALYRLQVCEDTSFTDPVINQGGIDTTSICCDLENNTTYYWRVIAKNSSGYGNWSDIKSFELDAETGIEDNTNDTSIPEEFALHQNFPNPFNPNTEIRYQLPKSAEVTIVIYNLQGQKVRTLVDEQKEAGIYTTIWNSRDNAGRQTVSGVYIYSLRAGDFIDTKKMVFMK